MTVDGQPFFGVFLAVDGTIEQDLAKQAQHRMLQNDCYETRRDYAKKLLEWAETIKKPSTSRVWAYAELLKNPNTQSNLEAVEKSNP